MLMNALSSYLQHQPAVADLKAASSQQVDETKLNNTATEEPSLSDYQASFRAIMVNAIASEFNVNDLPVSELSHFQSKLQEYGLIQERHLDAMSTIHTARRDQVIEMKIHAHRDIQINAISNHLDKNLDIKMKALAASFSAKREAQTDVKIDAVALVRKAHADATREGASYKHRQQVTHLHTLLSNIESARSQIYAPQVSAPQAPMSAQQYS